MAPAIPNPAIGWSIPAPFDPLEEPELELELGLVLEPADPLPLPLPLLLGTPCPFVVEALGVEVENVALPREEPVGPVEAPVPIGVAYVLPVPAGTVTAVP